MSRLVLPKPPRESQGRRYLEKLAQTIEVNDRRNLKVDDRIERTRRQVSEVSTTYTIGTGDDVVLCETTSAGFTVTLPPAADDKKELRIKNIGTNTLTIDGNASETIDGNLTIGLTADEAVRLVSDGTEWWIL
jgi:hypothetical protein